MFVEELRFKHRMGATHGRMISLQFSAEYRSTWRDNECLSISVSDRWRL